MEFHRYCKLFPKMTKEEFNDLAKSIEEVGLASPILSYHGEIVDGRHRYAACKLAKYKHTGDGDYVFPKEDIDEFTGTESELLEYLTALNLRRRHMTTGQLAVLGVDLLKEQLAAQAAEAKLPKPPKKIGTIGKIAPTAEEGRRRVGKDVGVSGGSIEVAEKVMESGDEKLKEGLRDGSLSVAEAKKALKGPSKSGTGTTKKTSKKKGTDAEVSTGKAKDDPSNLNQESYAQLPLTVVDTSDATHLFGSSKTLGTLIPTKGYHLKLVSDKTPPSNFSKHDNKDEFGF